MQTQLGNAKIEDYGWWDRVKIFFVQARWAEREDDTVRFYKLYKGRAVLIRTLEYRGYQ